MNIVPKTYIQEELNNSMEYIASRLVEDCAPTSEEIDIIAPIVDYALENSNYKTTASVHVYDDCENETNYQQVRTLGDSRAHVLNATHLIITTVTIIDADACGIYLPDFVDKYDNMRTAQKRNALAAKRAEIEAQRKALEAQISALDEQSAKL